MLFPRNLILTLFLGVCTFLHAQEHYAFTPLDCKNGLSENRVRNIVQLQDGRLVITTEGVTNIFDGTSFKHLHLKGENIGHLTGYTGFNHGYVDKDRVWIKNYKQLMIIDIKMERFFPNADSVVTSMGVKEPLADFFLDAFGNHWFRTYSDKLLFKSATSNKVILFKSRVSSPFGIKDELLDIAVIQQYVFLFYKSGLMVCFDLKTTKELYRSNAFSKEDPTYNTLMVVQSKKALFLLWNGNMGGKLLGYDIQKRAWHTLLKTNYWLNTLSIDRQDNLWVSCQRGLWFIDKGEQQKQFIPSFKLVDGTVINTEASTQCNDAQGGLWIGTFNHGLLYYHADRFKFKNFGKVFFEANKSDLNITCFEQNEPGTILIGTSKGLYQYHIEKSILTLYKGLPSTVSCTSMHTDKKNRTWICTDNQGLYCLQNKKLRHYELQNLLVTQVCETVNGTLYLSTYQQGLGLFNPETGVYKRSTIPGKENETNALTLLIPMNNTSMLGKGDMGFFVYDYKKRTIAHPLTELIRNENKQYNCVFKDSRGIVWIGTQDGLIVWQPKLNKTQTLFTDNGLINNSIKGIQEDKKGLVWISTAGGASRITVTEQKNNLQFSMANFNHVDGVIENEFMSGSIYMSNQGLMFMGGINGFNIIDLARPWISNQLSKPLFTNFLLFGVSVKLGEPYNGKVLLNQSITTTKRIVLNHNQNFISLDFSALNYVNPTQTYYRYRLEGIDDDWREILAVNGTGRATYTNLAPGTYTLKVKAASNSKIWSTVFAEMELVVKPPYWKTPFAYLIYFVLMLLLIYVSLVYYKRWSHQKMTRKNEEKLNEMKFSFFTNVSHEFRTPLTLIITPLESLLKEINETPLAPRIKNIYQHSLNLQRLVNQLLDFRRLEITGEKLNLTFGNLIEFVQLFEELFEKLAQEKNIKFSITSSESEIYIYFDKDKMYKIITNLLSNAFKFTPKGGAVNVHISLRTIDSKEVVQIEVTDTGTGIAPNDIPHLFNRFYQAAGVQGGSGIGLHLVKEYVKLHSGEIEIESEPNVRTLFRIHIPANLSTSKTEPTSIQALQDTSIITKGQEIDQKNYRLLVVEDNDDLRHFMVEELTKSYHIIEAADGEAGVALAKTELPDLIISDVLMPKMNGLDLCKQIKFDIQTSHIPVILLTARSSEEHKIEGYQSGADEYLSKPFNFDMLLLRIAGLIEKGNLRKKQFSQKIEVNPKEITITSIDEQLIEKALICMEENMDNPEYSVQQFSLDLGMDRTVLYKKLQSITGLSPSEFIRSIRLKRAAFLLQKGQFQVNEVADKVGFNSTKYFAKYFREAFGVPPSHYAKSGRNTEPEP
jgi:signal transduction histidine kinase/DNA-binding response OmpR family regulator/ligand-binding sensor domain-containing protein